jgi:biopolymer transport protein ExbD
MGKRKAPPKDADIPIESMIDIIFLLIIFFVVTAAMDKEIQDESIKLSNAPHGKPVKQKDPRSVTINVRRNGKINISGQVVSMGAVSDILTNAAAQYGTDIPIIIRGDRNALHGDVKKVLEAVTETSLYKVKFQALKDE